MALTFQQETSFISKIGPIVQKYAKEYGYKVASPIIAQACCESNYGTNNRATHNNFFGLKKRNNRCPSASGVFKDETREKDIKGYFFDPDEEWFEFETLEDGIQGFFDFLTHSQYSVLKNAETPDQYIRELGQCKYYTNLNYSEIVKRIIYAYNLYEYDNALKDSKDFRTKVNEESKEETNHIKIGSKIKLLTDTYYNGKRIPLWVKESTLYYRGVNNKGIKIGTRPIGPITGIVKDGMIKQLF